MDIHRDTVLSWLFEVVEDLGMSRQTYASAETLFDHYLQVHPVELEDMQKVSVVCVMVASKLHDVVGTFTMLHIETYFAVLLSPKEAVAMEWHLCTSLDWKLI
jgi:hypothetical protein